MNKCLIAILAALFSPVQAGSQGIFTLYNTGAQTRLGSVDGPLAGPGIWGQALVGINESSLSPLGPALEHDSLGAVGPITLSVPGVFAGEDVFVQMAAWDGTVWGTSFGQVPGNQIGYTDVLSIGLVSGQGLPAEVTRFTKPAVVPPVPEPGVLAMIVLGGMAMLCVVARRRRRSIRGSQ